jgi:hypothetical protein
MGAPNKPKAMRRHAYNPSYVIKPITPADVLETGMFRKPAFRSIAEKMVLYAN